MHGHADVISCGKHACAHRAAAVVIFNSDQQCEPSAAFRIRRGRMVSVQFFQ